MSVVVLNMKFIMTDTQFVPLNSILLFILNILPAEYSDEYPAGWYLVWLCKLGNGHAGKMKMKVRRSTEVSS